MKSLIKLSSVKKILFAAFLILITFFASHCSKDQVSDKNKVVIGIPSDVATLNPLYAFDLQEGHLSDLMFLKPAMEKWNDSLGMIELEPMLAESWVVNKDSGFITLNLRDNVYWSDGKPITVDDIIFSFDVYSDPAVNSRLYGLFGNFYSDENLHIDVRRTFRKNSDRSLTIFFKDIRKFSFLDINFAILPSHAYRKIDRADIATAEINFKPVTSGPFKLHKWDRDQKIHLIADSTSYLFNENNVQELIFKIVPDNFSLFTQLKTGEVDLIESFEAEQVKDLDNYKHLEIVSIKGRDYDYLGWNNIDPDAYQKKQIKPNRFFSSSKIRKALSIAINRNEIFKSVIGKFGLIYDSPISPIFKSYIDSSLFSFDYNPSLAKKMLEDEGWKDINGDGILERENKKFSFQIYSNTGNPIREYAATVIKNNLKEIGVEAEIVFVEKSELVDGLINRKYDAFLSGWTVQIPLNLDNFSNPSSEKGMFNFSSYYNQEVNKLLDNLNPADTESKKISTYKSISKIFKETEPITVLFWIDNLIAYNKRIKNLKISPLGLFNDAWNWKIEN